MDSNSLSKNPKKYYKIVGTRICLLPYLKEMVPKYSSWMQDPKILELTGSEPLTIDEEFENQVSWLVDPLKYTFIIFEKSEDPEFLEPTLPDICRGGMQVGDINLFFHEYLEPDEAEIDVMLGEEKSRGKGLAKEAIQIMIDFGSKYYEKKKIIAKIKEENEPSKILFEKLGFLKFAEVKVFSEVHYLLDLNSPTTWETPKYTIEEIIVKI